MVDYSKAKIYQVLNDVDDDIYIGSTCQSLSMRMSGHRRCYKHKSNKLHTKMREIGIEHFFIRLIEEYPECQNVEQLRRREGQLIIEPQPSLNSCIAGRTKNQWYMDNADRVKEQTKQNYLENIENRMKQRKDYRTKNCERLKDVRKKYYEENKEDINNKRKARVNCKICGKELSKGFMTEHLQQQHS